MNNYFELSQLIYWNTVLLYGTWMFTTWRWSYILRKVDYIYWTLYDDDVVIHWNSYLLPTSYVDNTIYSSDVAISDVCI